MFNGDAKSLTRSAVVKQVTETLAMLIKLEREAFGIDKEEKVSGGYESLLREVYKQNENNGRGFFVCAKPKKEQCDFFQWKD